MAGLSESENITGLSIDQINKVFTKSDNYIEKLYIDIDTGKPVLEIKDDTDKRIEKDKKECSKRAKTTFANEKKKDNKAKLSCYRQYQDIYKVYKDGKFSRYIFPVVGKGLWSTLKGFAAVDASGEKVVGLTFYSHGETPGLGGEIDSVKFKSDWASQKVIYKDNKVALKVAKGVAKDKTYEVDGLSGATLTGNGVSDMMEFWFGDYGYKKYLKGGT